jgi:hypothetical protein
VSTAGDRQGYTRGGTASPDTNVRRRVTGGREASQWTYDHVEHDVADHDDSTRHSDARDVAISPARRALLTTNSRFTCTLTPWV